MAPEQPFLLEQGRNLTIAAKDPDPQIWDHLREGAHTGHMPERPTRKANILPLRDPTGKTSPKDPSFDVCEGNLQSAEGDTALTQKLVDDEIQNGCVKISTDPADGGNKPGTLDQAI